MTGPELRDKIRAEAADTAFDDEIFSDACRCVTHVRETLRAHGKPDLSVMQDDAMTDAILQAIHDTLNNLA